MELWFALPLEKLRGTIHWIELIHINPYPWCALMLIILSPHTSFFPDLPYKLLFEKADSLRQVTLVWSLKEKIFQVDGPHTVYEVKINRLPSTQISRTSTLVDCNNTCFSAFSLLTARASRCIPCSLILLTSVWTKPRNSFFPPKL